MNLLELKDVTKQFGGLTAVDKLSLSMKKAKFWGSLVPTVQASPRHLTALRGCFPHKR